MIKNNIEKAYYTNNKLYSVHTSIRSVRNKCSYNCTNAGDKQ
ncbi:hypothetical protein BN1095_560037 [Clostridioides difficile]|uniref:Uncharacterized protein n=1 Tax=Clostridioides difficile TaxID=1496 RepID=A0A069ASV9_CLODI|nr:hypothetical protein BN163_1800003 [Clostridioides difficile T5]CCK91994.1 hypothetical protein BN164_1680003 [Clostridioides difficile T20]CCK95708.1 hypothetical protein BN165_1730003 [Clostridioides difficile E1]CCK99672.1 hypothetical protein BN166_2230007 [Clostridioides difficile E10]CCL03585.1 hypothetical protein BN167_1890012 [Clostridioides difficile E13]CCL08566.1 hypothetical protein BN168_650016 [Clostridioides difficile CD002]CCL12601.1 hypothetical protein BN169_850016 [Clos